MSNPTQVLSGARSVLFFGNQPVGYCLGVSCTTSINYQPLQVIGSLAVIEHVPTAYTVEMTAQMSRIAAVSRLNSSKISEPDGVSSILQAQQVSPQIMPAFGSDGIAILESGELTATIVDILQPPESQTLYTIKGVKCSQKSFEITGAGAVAENCTFVARYMQEGTPGGSSGTDENTNPLGTT